MQIKIKTMPIQIPSWASTLSSSKFLREGRKKIITSAKSYKVRFSHCSLRLRRHKVGPNSKIPPKIKWKKIREIDWSYFMLATIWQISNMKHTQSPETEIMGNWLNLLGKKFVKSHRGKLIFGGFGLGMPKSRDLFNLLLPGFSGNSNPGIFWSRDNWGPMFNPGILSM